ncbi:MAG: ABC transporter substrate-binding protein [Firmicutes bacterium]|nr:ABC transporter substrate-binding protein [Bacillota bacterium]
MNANRKMLRSRLLAIALGLMVLVALWGLPVKAQRKAIMQLEWTPNTNHTGIYVALDKGWYAEEGVDLEIVTPGSDTNVLALVAAGRAHFGVSVQEYTTSARTEGFPVVSVAAIVQHNTSGFASIGRGIKTAADFEGKRYGGWMLPLERAILGSMMARDGADVDKVQFVSIPGSIDLITLLTRDIDFTWIYYGWQGIEAQLRGVELDIVMMNDYFDAVPDYYTPILVTSESLIETDPDLVGAVVRATARGYTYAAQNPEEAAEILLKYAPENDPALVRASQKWLSPRYIDDAPYFGHQRLEVWQAFGDWMYSNGLIQEPFDAQAAFTNEFLPKD